jgi:hypothetical protein
VFPFTGTSHYHWPVHFFWVQIAAFIAEPVMGAGGVILPPETYFDKVISHRQCFRLEFTLFSVFKNFFMKFSMISIWNGVNKIIKKSKMFSYFSNQTGLKSCFWLIYSNAFSFVFSVPKRWKITRRNYL